jgi:hypothetical protein
MKDKIKNITIDGVDYPLDKLSELLKKQLASLRAADVEIIKTQNILAFLQTARATYAKEIKRELSK